MTSKLKSVVLGTGLLVVAGYSAAQTPSAQWTAASDDSVIVTGTHRTDGEIRADVKSRLDEHAELAFDNIDVQSVDHRVYLRGIVSSGVEAEEAAAIAGSVAGVTRVYNALAEAGN